MATWPGTLPTDMDWPGLGYELADNSIRTQMDAGPAKVRQRFSASMRNLTFTMLMTRTQGGILVDFYENTLGGGSDTFTGLADILDGSSPTYRFTKPPSFSPMSAVYVRATISLETIP